MMGERWVKWTIGEAGTKTVSAVVQKMIGIVSTTYGHTFWATCIVGIVQTIFGFSECLRKKKGILDSPKNILGAMLFGLLAVGSTVLGFITFLEGAELGARVFIITLSIIPGALIDQVFFGKQLSARQWLGIFIGIGAGWAVLGSPEVILGVWVWFAIVNMMLVAINQGITQTIKDIDVMRKNFWGGLVAVIIGGGAAFVLLDWDELVGFDGIHTLTIMSAIIGGIVIFMWAFNVWAYKDGAYIALKKLLMNGCYLTLSMIIGIVAFGEPAVLGKFVGVFLFLLALVLLDDKTWEAVHVFVNSFSRARIKVRDSK